MIHRWTIRHSLWLSICGSLLTYLTMTCFIWAAGLNLLSAYLGAAICATGSVIIGLVEQFMDCRRNGAEP